MVACTFPVHALHPQKKRVNTAIRGYINNPRGSKHDYEGRLQVQFNVTPDSNIGASPTGVSD